MSTSKWGLTYTHYMCYNTKVGKKLVLDNNNNERAELMLNKQEGKQLADLLGKLSFPCSPEVFNALCNNLITNPYELAVLKGRLSGNPEVLMIYREDNWYKGWHIPGTVMLPGDTEESAFRRLVTKEVGGDVTTAEFVDRMHFKAGNGYGENPRGQEISLLFTCDLVGEVYSRRGKFFPLNKIPKNTLTSHVALIERVRRWIQK